MRVSSMIPYSDRLRTAAFFFKMFGVGFERYRVIQHYVTSKLFPEYADEIHLKATMEWLGRGQDVCNGDGVSNLFSLHTGWGVAYPETSGYILATFFVYADYSGDNSYIDRATKIGDWEIEIQAPNGGVFSSTILRQTRVFNTGQVILGWCVLFERTGDEKYLLAAKRAGDYLLNLQEVDGAWQRDTYCGARTYHARVDWGLLRLAELSGEQRYANAAVNNLKWVIKQQYQNGWFGNCGFNDDHPNMHVIVYTLRGLLECSQMNNVALKSLELLPHVLKAADALCNALQTQTINGITGMVPAAFDEKWNAAANDSCLTGNAQLAGLLYRLAHITENKIYKHVADNVISATKRTQQTTTKLMEINGAIAGTYPLFHGYLQNAYPNWAAKFFADALLMKINFDKRLVVPA